jgi:hypothetical protein
MARGPLLKQAVAFIVAGSGFVLTACSGQPTTAGLSEPIVVQFGSAQNAQFIKGSLPGQPPLTSDQVNAGVAAVTPSVPAVTVTGQAVSPLQANKAFSGLASGDAVAVAIGFADLGSGYWVFPVGPPDLLQASQYTWKASVSFGADIPAGLHPLNFAAIDAAGHAGTQNSIQLCVESAVPDNFNACFPSKDPPNTVLSLNWDTPVDLDLQVQTPSGKLVDAKHPSTTEQADGGLEPAAPNVGTLDRDSDRGCTSDGVHREDMVWEQKPDPGLYYVYANLYDACGQPAVHFNLSLYQAEAGIEAGTERLVQVFVRSGELLSADANGGAGIGLFVTQVLVQ